MYPGMMPGGVFAAEEYTHAVQLFSQISRLNRVFLHMRPKPPLRRGELAVLGAVEHMTAHGEGAVSMSKLAGQMGLSLPAISQKVAELEKLGLAQRVMSEEDRRVVQVTLTAGGKKTAEDSLREMMARTENALARFGDEKTGALLALLADLNAAMDETPEKSSP